MTVACTKAETPNARSYFQIPWPAGQGQYQIQNVPVSTFSAPDQLSGTTARILIDPYLAGDALQGRSIGRFISIGDNVFVPADFLTMQAATVYAHLEKLAEMDRQLGFGAQINWPLTIGLNANVVDERGSLRNNALYDGRLDSLLIVPYVDRRLPISLNAGVLAHEHFHKVFQTLVMTKVRRSFQERGHKAFDDESFCNWATQENLPEVPDFGAPSAAQIKDPSSGVTPFVYNEFLLRAMNEGLADFWGWVYSGDPSFIGRSLNDRENEFRRLDVDTTALPSMEILKYNLSRIEQDYKSKASRDAMRISLAYEIGTYYARFMRALALKISNGSEETFTERVELAKALAAILPTLGDSVSSQLSKTGSDEFISPNMFLSPLFEKLPKVTSSACDALDKFAAPESKLNSAPMVCVRIREGEKATAAKKNPPATPPRYPGLGT
jgi:uncharacterized protein (UPF0297 family)